MSTWPNPFDGAYTLYFPTVQSTMFEAERIIKINPEPVSGTTVVAGYQTAGRGRFLSRKWYSGRNKNLLFTTIFLIEDIPFNYLKMPLLLGGIISAVVDKMYGLSTLIKWPNDIIVVDDERIRKLGGILCEAKGRYLLAGIGINCNEDFKENVPELTRAVSLRVLRGEEVDIKELFYNVLEKIKLELFVEYNEDFSMNRVRSLLYGRGKVVQIANNHTDRERVSGKIVDIANDGALLLENDQEERVRVISGEVVGLY